MGFTVFGDVRGVGLMLGVEMILPTGEPDPESALALVQSALRDGIFLLADSPASNVLSLSPPFGITNEEIGFVVEWLRGKLSH